MDKVYIYNYQADAEKPLSLKQSIKTNTASGPRHLTFSTNGKFAYLVHEFNGKISVFSYNNGNLTFNYGSGLVKSGNNLVNTLDNNCNPYAVKAGIGSIVLWDSRTIHQGKEPEKLRVNENFRIAVYVCMMPRNMSNNKALEKKRKAFNELRVTNHWANNPKLFPKSPRTYGNEIPEFNQIHPPQLNEIGMRLAGFE